MQLRLPFDTFPVVPLSLTWSSSPPPRSSIPPSSLWNFTCSDALVSPHAISWPPTPLMAMVLYPFVRVMYLRFFDKLTKFVTGSHTDAANRDGGPIRRVVWALNEDGPAPLRVRISANIDLARPEGAARPAGKGAPNAQAQEGQGAAQQQSLEGNENNPPDNPAAVAERTLHITTSSLGRFVGGALLISTISNRMSKLLYHLSQYSPFLRTFLAIGECSGQAVRYPSWELQRSHAPDWGASRNRNQRYVWWYAYMEHSRSRVVELLLKLS